MAQILVRKLDEEVVKRLKERASENGRSIEELQKRFEGRPFPDSADLIREDRDR